MSKDKDKDKDKLPALGTALKAAQAASIWTLNSKSRRQNLLQSLSHKIIAPAATGTGGAHAASLSASASAGAIAEEESEREKEARRKAAKVEAERARRATLLHEENVHAVARRKEVLKKRNYNAKVARGEVRPSLARFSRDGTDVYWRPRYPSNSPPFHKPHSSGSDGAQKENTTTQRSLRRCRGGLRCHQKCKSCRSSPLTTKLPTSVLART